MSTGFVGDPNEIVKLGQFVKVRVMEIDDQHRINLSMLFGEDAKAKPAESRSGGGDRGGRGGGGFRRGPRRF
jgi:predicted RNA-binding protein with RPS1 domain